MGLNGLINMIKCVKKQLEIHMILSQKAKKKMVIVVA